MPVARCAWIAAFILAAIPAYAQSLGELARQEEARRADTTKATKTLSNSDLRPQDATGASPAPAAECFVSISQGRCVSAEEIVALSSANVLVPTQNTTVEQTWRRDSASLRARVAGAQQTVATFEAIAADDTKPPSDRKSAQRSLVTARQALAAYEWQWEKHETAAGAMRIPRAWIEPIPTLTKSQPQQ